MKHILAGLALLAIATPAYTGCTAGGLCVDSSGKSFVVSPNGTIQGITITGQRFTGSQSSNGVTITTPVPQGLPLLPLMGTQK